MSTFDATSPDQSHLALSDLDKTRLNTKALRDLEQSAAASPPSNPVGGQFWWASDTKVLYQRSQDNTAWNYVWSESDPPAKSSDLTNHIALNITQAVAVHGVKQGSGNGFDADLLDGQHASAFAAAGHLHTGVYEPVFSKNSAFNKSFGTAAGTVCQGNDSRLSDQRTPPDGSVTPAKLSDMATGNYLISANAPERSVTVNNNWGKIKETKIGAGGTYKVFYNAKGSVTSGCSARLYVNGSPIGTQHNNLNTSYDSGWYQNISGLSAGDLIQVYGGSVGNVTIYAKDLELYVNAPHLPGYDPTY
jgi:hypothetical protein